MCEGVRGDAKGRGGIAPAKRVEQCRVESEGVVVCHPRPARRRLAARDEACLCLVGEEHVRHLAQDRQRAPVAAREDPLERRGVEGVRQHRRLELLWRLGRAVREEDDAPHALQPGGALHAAARPVEPLRRHQPDHHLGQRQLATRSFHLRLCRHQLRLGLARRKCRYRLTRSDGRGRLTIARHRRRGIAAGLRAAGAAPEREHQHCDHQGQNRRRRSWRAAEGVAHGETGARHD